jgi:hypothetical protein
MINDSDFVMALLLIWICDQFVSILLRYFNP